MVNQEFYKLCANKLRTIFLNVVHHNILPLGCNYEDKKSSGLWTLKTHISVIRHGDRTPKRKLKIQVGEKYFLELFETLSDCTVNPKEILVSDKEKLKKVLQTCEKVIEMIKEKRNLFDPYNLRKFCAPKSVQSPEIEDSEELSKLNIFTEILTKKLHDPDVKFQLRKVQKPQKTLMIILKWGGEFTHAARHQSVELGSQLRIELDTMNKKIIQDFKVFTSGERRVMATADSFTKSFLQLSQLPLDSIVISKKLLDDTFDGKDQIDECKSLLKKKMTSDRTYTNADMPLHNNIINLNIKLPSPSIGNSVNVLVPNDPLNFISRFILLIVFLKNIFIRNWSSSLHLINQKKWCCSDSTDIFKERWTSIFDNFPDLESYDNSNAINMYDSLKFDAIHNKDILEIVFKDKYNLKDPLEKLHELYLMSSQLFCYLVPHEYGLTHGQKLKIGLNVSGALLAEIISQVEKSYGQNEPFCRFYFTKESHVYTLVNLILESKIKNNHVTQELDYMTQITFEVYERNNNGQKEQSFRIGISPGSQSICGALKVQDMGINHTIYPAKKIWITDYVKLDIAIKNLMAVGLGIADFV